MVLRNYFSRELPTVLNVEPQLTWPTFTIAMVMVEHATAETCET